MTSFCLRSLLIISVVLATAAVSVVADGPQDGADLADPIMLNSKKTDSLDELDVGPVKPRPYTLLEDDPPTPTSQSTVSQFLTNVEDVDPYDILERPGVPVGWFAGLELTAANSSVSNRMQSGNLVGAFPNPISAPSTPLDWTAMPKFTLGYRRPEGLGELSASYRFLLSQGDGKVSPFNGGVGSVSSRLQVHVLDLDYTVTDLFPDDLWLVPRQVRLTGGVRVAGTDYKTSASGGTILGQSASNTFVGAGPRFAAESIYPLLSSQWSLFGKVDAAGVIGSDRQSFSQSTSGPGAASGSGTSSSTVAVPVAGLRTGANWFPDWGSGNFKLSAGYQWERWFFMGTDTNSYNELTIQGPFLQGEVAF